MELIKEGNQVKIYHDIENGWLFLDWFGTVKNDWIIEGMELLYDAFQETGVNVILNDNTNLKGTFTGVLDYIINDWYPKALKTGYKRAALIYSSDIFTRFSIDAYQKQDADSPIEQKTVDSVEEARAWLLECAAKEKQAVS